MPDYVVAGKDAFARQSKNAIMGHEVTLADVFWDTYKLHLHPAITDRIAGAQALQLVLSYKADEEGRLVKKPRLYFAKRRTGIKDSNGFEIYKRICEPTIEEIVSLESNPKRPEDIKQEGVADHAFDRTKYYLLSASSPPQIPANRRQENIVRDYGRQKESFETIEDAEFEDISGYGEGSIADY
jgi:hypothetical protein